MSTPPKSLLEIHSARALMASATAKRASSSMNSDYCRSMTPGTRILRLPHPVAVASDVFALVVFVTLGATNHDVSWGGWARDLAIFVTCWLIAAGGFDLYKRPRISALLATWLTAISAGVLVRALFLWHLEGDDGVFLVIALSFSLLFVVIARGLAVLRT